MSVFTPLPTNPVLVYNSSIPQSLTDAQWYAQQRSLPANYLGFAFGTSSVFVADTTYNNASTFACTKAIAGGIDVTTTYTGLSIHAAWTLFQVTYGINCVLVSTYTPFEFDNTSGNFGLGTFPGQLSYDANGSSFTATPYGRLGCSGQIQGGYPQQSNIELTPASGSALINGVSPLLYKCVTGAMTAEGQNNLTKPHWSSSYMFYNDYVTSSNNAQILAWLNGNGFNTVDLGGSQGDANVNFPSWYGGSLSSLNQLFAYSIGGGQLNDPTNGTEYAGGRTFSQSYVAMPGAWAFNWCSFSFILGMDVLYNGGSAAFVTDNEPLATGLRDPFLIYQALIVNRMSMAQVMSTVIWSSVGQTSTPSSYPNYTNSATLPLNLCAVGDPLYRPYKSTFYPASAGLIAGLKFGVS